MSPSPTTSAHAATNDDTLQQSAESTKSLKRKSKKAKEDEREENRREQLQGRSDTAVTEQVQTKHNDVNTLQEHMSVMDTAVKKRKKDKSKGSQPEERPTNPSLDLGELENPKSHRKTKKRKSTAEAEADGGPDLNDEKPKTKKRKKSTEFTDPNDDSSISDQSKKALAYVFSQSVKPKTWKFNKARQNWLIRNLWSPEAIPEKYVTLVVRYLSNVQGRVRDTLIESCNKILDSPTTNEVENGVQQNPENAKDNLADKEQRARLLLDALSDNS